MFERFTRSARQVVVGACEAADRLGHERVRPEHILLGVAATEDTVAARMLAESGLDAPGLERALTAQSRRPLLSDSEVDALRAVGIDAEEVYRRVEEAFADAEWFLVDEAATAPDQRRGLFGRIGGGRFDKPAKQVLTESLRQAIALKHREIGPEHILLGVLATASPPLAGLLATHGLAYEQARDRVLDALRPTRPR